MHLCFDETACLDLFSLSTSPQHQHFSSADKTFQSTCQHDKLEITSTRNRFLTFEFAA